MNNKTDPKILETDILQSGSHSMIPGTHRNAHATLIRDPDR